LDFPLSGLFLKAERSPVIFCENRYVETNYEPDLHNNYLNLIRMGVEFLLMGLTKQPNCVLPKLFSEMGIDSMEFRGLLRGLAGVATADWRQKDVKLLGAEALPHLRTLDPGALRQSLDEGVEPPPVITPRMQALLETAKELAGESQIGHNHLLMAAFRHHQSLAVQWLFNVAHNAGWSPEQVVKRLAELAEVDINEFMDASPKSPDAPPRRPEPKAPNIPPRRGRGGSVVTELGRDLTQAAREGKLNPAEGESARQAMRQIGRILLQSEANNPIILGDSGVGKTAVVEGFAWRVAGQGKPVIEQLSNKRIVELPVNTLLAGTKYRGDLEERLQRLLAEVKASDGQTIVFIDEIHSILGGGASGGLSSIADALKPALSRGELPCIGATTVAG
jgi:ATP-dependent Clp protease ATP-binding subunit ClpA